jgi:hypothetical protein
MSEQSVIDWDLETVPDLPAAPLLRLSGLFQKRSRRPAE